MKTVNNYSIIYVNEKNCNLYYKNIELKKKRPYLVLNNQASRGNYLLAQLTNLFDEQGIVKQRHKYWLETNKLKNPSYIQLDNIYHIKRYHLKNQNIEYSGKELNSSEKRKAKEILSNIFQYSN